MRNLRQIITALVLLIGYHASAQQAGVKLLAKAKSKSILLRWAPNTPETWSIANKNGYQIERYTIAKGRSVLSNPVKLILSSPLKPKPLEQWKDDALKNSNSAIAAQAIYGKTFEASIGPSNSLTTIVNKSREQEQRFSFALFSADQSFVTAKLSGLAFVDSTVKSDERYLYRVFVLNTIKTLKLDTGLFYVGLKDSVGLAPPSNLQASFADRVVLIKWPKLLVEKQYNSFIIERAEADKGVFTRTRFLPYINTRDGNDPYYQSIDSLPQNGVEYQFRVRGVTAFGETGPESERVSGKGFRTMRAKAVVSEAKDEKGTASITWTVTGDPTLITGFDVERSGTPSGEYHAVNKTELPASERKFIDATPEGTNYYRIKAFGEQGQVSTSFEHLIQLPDSIPPSPPQKLVVKIDTLGIARLSWTSNKENDLLGYRVFRSNFSTAEFSMINSNIVPSNSYKDSINIRRLDKKIYYRLVALDKRMNPSAYSEIVVAELPDVVPPAPAAISWVKSTADGINISWNRSTSNDVKAYQLLRKPKDSIGWKVVKEFGLIDSAYTDRSAISGKAYHYSIRTIDTGGLKSNSPAALIRATLKNEKPPIINPKIEADRASKNVVLRWKYGQPGISKYLIYRSIGDEPITLYKTISGTSNEWRDENVKMETNYHYRIKASFNDGSESQFTPELVIKY